MTLLLPNHLRVSSTFISALPTTRQSAVFSGPFIYCRLCKIIEIDNFVPKELNFSMKDAISLFEFQDRLLVSFKIESANQPFRRAYFLSDTHALSLRNSCAFPCEIPGSFSNEDGTATKRSLENKRTCTTVTILRLSHLVRSLQCWPATGLA